MAGLPAPRLLRPAVAGEAHGESCARRIARFGGPRHADGRWAPLPGASHSVDLAWHTLL